MGVDPKRPLVGFAVVSVLCAVLMAMSVGRGSGTDVFGPGRPIATPVAGDQLDRIPAPPAPPRLTTVSIPAELSPSPLGEAPGGPVPTQDASPASHPVSVEPAVETTVADATGVVATKAGRKTDSQGGRTSDRSDGKAAEKAVEKAQRAADKAARTAEKTAAKAVRKADKAATKATAKAARKAAKAAAKAARKAAKVARKG